MITIVKKYAKIVKKYAKIVKFLSNPLPKNYGLILWSTPFDPLRLTKTITDFFSVFLQTFLQKSKMDNLKMSKIDFCKKLFGEKKVLYIQSLTIYIIVRTI
jgi:hypothetical protein